MRTPELKPWKQLMHPKQITENEAQEILRHVIDPELGCNIVDLGLVYGISITPGKIKISMSLTSPGCPMSESIRYGVQTALLNDFRVAEAEVVLVWSPRWNPDMMTEAGKAATGYCNF